MKTVGRPKVLTDEERKVREYERQKKYHESHRELYRESAKRLYVPISSLTEEEKAERRRLQNERSRKWYSINKDKHLLRTNDWRSRNIDRVNERNQERRDCGYRAVERANWKKRFEADPEKCRQYERRRRARRMDAQGFHSLDKWIARVEYHGWKCVYCGKDLTRKTLTKDHRIALSRGGSEWPSNLVPACKKCNCGKGDRTHYTPRTLKGDGHGEA